MRTLFLLVFLLLRSISNAQDPCDVSLTGTPLSCPDEHDATLTVVQGQGGPFTFEWLHAPFPTTATATGLSIGPYTVIVTGALGCESVLDTVIENPEVPALGSMTITNISCAGNDDGAITFQVSPGPYTWEWVDGAAGTNPTLTDLGPGTYVTKVIGGECPSYIFGHLGDPDITIQGATEYCPSAPPELTTNLEWGFQPDVYVWNTGATTSAIQVVPGMAGSIIVTATDTTIGCTASGEIFLTELAHPSVAFSAPDTLCVRVAGLAVTTLSTADSLVWRWGADGFSNDIDPSISFDGPEWQPITLQGFYQPGCGSAPVKDSVFVRPRIPANYTAAQIPCTPMIEVHLMSEADSCAFFIGDRLVTTACQGFFEFDLRRYEPYDVVFYSTQPDRCDDTLAMTIDVHTVPVLFLPTAFTPNNDGINDTWPGLVDIPTAGYEVQLFDRWGTNLWSTRDTQAKWDGSSLPTGVYVYTMRMEDPCEPKKEIARNGTVTLLR